jgi:hypothetical protein
VSLEDSDDEFGLDAETEAAMADAGTSLHGHAPFKRYITDDFRYG